MINLKQSLQKLTKSFKNKRQKDGEYMHPLRHWMYGLTSSVVVFVLGISFIAFDFYRQFGTQVESTVLVDPQVTYPEREVRNLSEQYSERQREFEKLRGQRPVLSAQPAEVAALPESAPELEQDDATLAE